MKNEIIINTTKGNQTINMDEYDMVTVQFTKHQRMLNIYLTKANIPAPLPIVTPEPIPTPVTKPTPTPTTKPTPYKPNAKPAETLKNITESELLLLYRSYIDGHATQTEIGKKLRLNKQAIGIWFKFITKYINNEPVPKGNYEKLQKVADLYTQSK